MKKLITYLLLLACVFGNAQILPSLVSQSKRRNVSQPPPPPTTNNLIEEQAYFASHFLPISEKANIQTALNTYGSVRLDKGDYSGVPITMTSNQSLYGHPEVTTVSPITIAAGSTGGRLESVKILTSQDITFEAGAPITNWTLKHIGGTRLYSLGGSLEDNLFIDINARIYFDCGVSGYLRNNRVYRQAVSTISPQLILNGNNTTPSDGNLFVWGNYLTPNGDAVLIDNLGNFTFIGLDSEGWNLRNEETVNAMFYARNMGEVIITDFGGANGYQAANETRAWDIEADNIMFLNKGIGHVTSQETDNPLVNPSIARANANVFGVKSLLLREVYEMEAGSTGIDLQGHYNGDSNTTGIPNFETRINNVTQASTIVDAGLLNTLTSQILRPEYQPYPRVTFESVPNPTGSNWATERIGKPDSTAYIQNLIDTDRIAELPEGVFYISSTLFINGNVGNTQGIIGQGSGKTAIVGLTDDFPLITATTTQDQTLRYHLSNITLQGGSVGFYLALDVNLVNGNTWKNVVFRNQAKGIHFYWIYGFDNNFLDNVSFVDCGIGVHQEPRLPRTSPSNFDDTSYIDKTTFYRCQFINCGISMLMRADRGNNLNCWIDCNFDNNDSCGDVTGNNFAFFANCDFTNNTGTAIDGSVLTGDQISIYNGYFNNNTANYIFDAKTIYAEGSNFLDNVSLCSPVTQISQSQYILNSTISGALGGGLTRNDGMYINSNFTQDATLSKLFVNMTNNVKATIIDAPVNPYPQFFVKHTLNN